MPQEVQREFVIKAIEALFTKANEIAEDLESGELSGVLASRARSFLVDFEEFRLETEKKAKNLRTKLERHKLV